MIYYEAETRVEWDFDPRKVGEEIIQRALTYLGCPYPVEISLFLTDNEKIAEVNEEFRGKATPTDVLSFPMLEFSQPADFSFILPKDPFLFSPEDGSLLLGDIMISYQKVEEQSELYGHSLLREFAFLLVHSILHLVGYDHIQEEEKENMEKIQREIMEYLEIRR